MPDYKTLYFQLFNQVTDIIEAFQKAQQDAESAYIESEDGDENIENKL